MARVVLSARIEADLAGWAKVYAKRRDVTVASVVEAALREFREACEGGVPDLSRSIGELEDTRPVMPQPKRRPPATSYEEMMRERQVRLNRGRG